MTPPADGAMATPFGPAWLRSDEAAGAVTQQRQHEKERIEQSLTRLRALLANSDFTSKAPAEVVDRERTRLRVLEGELRQLGG
ncbi:MAG: hypothetical protein E6J39_07055 [Chloroflexi bacterium]|nr:MAG: hypothetical protein E6J39_07055 [Chloroflexota bacterium]